jgi:hypothetical protein
MDTVEAVEGNASFVDLLGNIPFPWPSPVSEERFMIKEGLRAIGALILTFLYLPFLILGLDFWSPE